MEADEGGVLGVVLELEGLSLVLLFVLCAVDLAVIPDVLHSHFVLGQSAGLVRADAGGGAEGFDCLEVLDQHLLLVESLRGDGKRDGDAAEQALGHVGDQDSDSKDHALEVAEPGDDSGQDEEPYSENQGDHSDQQHEPVELFAQRRFDGFTRAGQVRDLSQHCLFGNVHHDAPAFALLHQCPEEGQVLGLKGLVGVGTLDSTEEGVALSR